MSGLRWWWLRHAPTGLSGAIGHSDVAADLSDRAALARLGTCLPVGAPLITSDLARARMTAAALAHPGPRLPDCPAFRELDFGAWEGLAFDTIAARDPEAARAFWDAPGPSRAPGGEGWDDLVARVGAGIARFNAAPPGPDLVVVAHAGVIRAALALALDLPPARAFAFRVAPLSLTRIDWLVPPGAWAVDRVNQVP